MSSNGEDETASAWGQRADEYQVDRGGAFHSKTQLRPDQVISNVSNQTEAYAPYLADACVGNWLLWGVKDKEFVLGTGFLLSGKANVTFDPERLGAYCRLLNAPESATERDVYTLLCGTRNQTHQTPRTNFLSHPDHPLEGRIFVDDPNFFASRYSGLSFKEALALSKLDMQDVPRIGAMPVPIAQPQDVRYDELWRWQQVVADKAAVPEDARFGRSIQWYEDELGKRGKTVLSRYIAKLPENMMLTFNNAVDCLYLVAQFFNK